MSDPHWTSYVGMITGVIGSVLGFIGYRTSKKHKTADLRIQLKMILTHSVNLHQELCKSLDLTNSSRRNIDAAGLSRSGGTDAWEKEFKEDKEFLGELGKSLPISHRSIDGMKDHELETNLIEIHRVKDQLDRLKEKYSRLDEQIKDRKKARRDEFISQKI